MGGAPAAAPRPVAGRRQPSRRRLALGRRARHAAARLIAAGAGRAIDLRAGGLWPGSRSGSTRASSPIGAIPGDAGVPPTFDFAASQNLKAARVEYPAPAPPRRGGAEAFGYDGRVIFPLHGHAAGPGAARDARPRPRLRGLRQDLPAGHGPAAARSRGAAACRSRRRCVRRRASDVPRRAGVGAGGAAARSIAAHAAAGRRASGRGDGAGRRPARCSSRRRSAGSCRRRPAQPVRAGRAFSFTRGAARAAGRRPGAERAVRLTLVSPAGAIEVPVRLDAGRADSRKEGVHPLGLLGASMSIQVGDPLPQATFFVIGPDGVEPRTTESLQGQEGRALRRSGRLHADLRPQPPARLSRATPTRSRPRASTRSRSRASTTSS